MAITTHGLEVTTDYDFLQKTDTEDDGVTVKVTTDWFSDVRNHELTQEQQQAIQQARSQGLLGLQLEGHEPTPTDAQNRINTVVGNWFADINAFITDFNANQSE